MIEPFLIESIISNLITQTSKRIIKNPKDRASFDFIYKDNKGITKAVEVKSQKVSKNTIIRFSEILKGYPEVDEFHLVTPNNPTKQKRNQFNEILLKINKKVFWNGVADFLKEFDLNVSSSEDLHHLQTATVAVIAASNSKEHIGSVLVTNGLNKIKEKYINIKSGEERIDVDMISLRRQFPDQILTHLSRDKDNLYKQLSIGRKYRKAIIVLTDIKNFSTVVSKADPEDLQDTMHKYYLNARDLVFKYGGILDKFIGDAVLAIFNYPKYFDHSSLSALKFSSELIQMGYELLNDILRKMDNEIETGTRVGITTGPIYTLNIGRDNLEISFIGDKINLSARLEKNCALNGILASNAFYNVLKEKYTRLINEDRFIKAKVKPTEAKGQDTNITAWQIYENNIVDLLSFSIEDET